MSFLTDEQLDQISIERMIFHVLGPDMETPLLLDEVREPTKFSDFFLQRIKETHSGSLFDFQDLSVLRQGLQTILSDTNQFVAVSKQITESFHIHHNKTTSAGLLLLFLLRAGSERLFSLIKYDDSSVLSYAVQDLTDKKAGVLAELQHTLHKQKTAMQKSALIRINKGGDDVVAIDRSARVDITHYFRAFLGAKRRFQANEITKRFVEAITATAKAHKNELGAERVAKIRTITYGALKTIKGYSPEQTDSLLSAVFGPLDAESPIRETFQKQLKSRSVQTESFNFDLSLVPEPRKKLLQTDEGVDIIFDQKLRGDRITEVTGDGGETIIQIKTSGIIYDGDYDAREKGARSSVKEQ